MPVTKYEVVSQLEEISLLLDVLGEDAFRAKSYASAARNLETFEGAFEMLFAEDKLTTIRGIGKSLSEEIGTLKTRETLALLDELRERVPESVRGLFRVSGLGAKKVAALWQNGITGVEELIEASKDGRLAGMKGFGKKSAENFQKAAEFVLSSQKRMRIKYRCFIERSLTQSAYRNFRKPAKMFRNYRQHQFAYFKRDCKRCGEGFRVCCNHQ
jgi:DNA polymerase (family X)